MSRKRRGSSAKTTQTTKPREASIASPAAIVFTSSTPPTTGRRVGSLAAIAAGALAIRLVHLVSLWATPLFGVLIGDSAVYDAWARDIASGHWLGSGVFYQAPLYPYLLGTVYAIAGHHVFLIRVLQAVLGSASCVLLALAGRRFFSPRVGLIAGALLAVYPPAIFFDGLLQKSSVDLWLMTLTLLLAAEFMHKPHAKWLVAAGVTVGALMLNRENARVLYPIIAVWLLVGFAGVPVRRRLAWVAVFTAVLAAVLVPVGVRNYRVGGEFLISTSQFGPNFYIGNHAGATGTYDPLVPDRGDAAHEQADATRLAEEAVGRKLQAGEVSQYWLGRSLAFIRSQPGHWLALMGRKTLLALNTSEFVDTESIQAYAEHSPVLRVLGWITFGVIFPLAVLGVWVTRAAWRQLALLYVTFAGLVASVAVFYVLARYRFPALPIVLLFAAAAVSAMPALFAEWRPALPGLVAAVVAAAIVNVPMATSVDPTYFNIGTQLMVLERPAEAIPWLQRGAVESPNLAPVHQFLGMAFSRTGQRDRAISEFATAVKLRPDYGEAYATLALALLGAGDAASALPIAGEAVRLKPDSAEAQGAMGEALWRAGRRPEAITHYLEAARLGPGDATAQNNVGTALLQDDKAREAIPYFKVALSLNPDYAEAHSNLALAEQATGDLRGAAGEFAVAVRLQPGNFGMRANYGTLLMNLGRTADAIAQYEQASAVLPASPDDAVSVLSLLAQGYALGDRKKDAIATLERAVAIAQAAGRTDLADPLVRTLRAWKG